MQYIICRILEVVDEKKNFCQMSNFAYILETVRAVKMRFEKIGIVQKSKYKHFSLVVSGIVKNSKN